MATYGRQMRPRLLISRGSTAARIGIVPAQKPVVRGGIEPPTFRFSGGRSYQLSYLTSPGSRKVAARPQPPPTGAVLTGFEPATSTLTGWRALRAALQDQGCRTAAAANRALHTMRNTPPLPTRACS